VKDLKNDHYKIIGINKWIKLKYFKNTEYPFIEHTEQTSANESVVIDLIGSIPFSIWDIYV